MAQPDIPALARGLNERSSAYRIGGLQEIRTQLKRLGRRPGSVIFGDQTITDEYAFHLGGRSELQFNIGYEEVRGEAYVRCGVAFSFETSRSLPTTDPLLPKVARYNEFLRLYSDLYADLRMWHYRDEIRSAEQLPGPIAPELARPRTFIFLGDLQRSADFEHEQCLAAFDRLLPLYEYVEGGADAEPVIMPATGGFQFRPGCPAKASHTTASRESQELDVSLRHNELQTALYDRLVAEHGPDNVGTEVPSGAGTRVDVAVRRDGGFWFYEIKTASSPRACIREAIGQLLEYSFWPGTNSALRLVVVGESALDDDARQYVSTLNRAFPAHVEYEQVIATGVAPLASTPPMVSPQSS